MSYYYLILKDDKIYLHDSSPLDQAKIDALFRYYFNNNRGQVKEIDNHIALEVVKNSYDNNNYYDFLQEIIGFSDEETSLVKSYSDGYLIVMVVNTDIFPFLDSSKNCVCCIQRRKEKDPMWVQSGYEKSQNYFVLEIFKDIKPFFEIMYEFENSIVEKIDISFIRDLMTKYLNVDPAKKNVYFYFAPPYHL